jgi:hypothetical protein
MSYRYYLGGRLALYRTKDQNDEGYQGRFACRRVAADPGRGQNLRRLTFRHRYNLQIQDWHFIASVFA